jgi:hypothetical protein
MTTPSQAPLSREEWRLAIDQLAKLFAEVGFNDAGYGFNPEKVSKEADADEHKTALFCAIMALQAEVERLRAIVSDVHSMAVQAGIRGEFVPTDFILAAIEKARQPK